MVWTVLTVVQQLEFAALFVLCFLMGIVSGNQYNMMSDPWDSVVRLVCARSGSMSKPEHPSMVKAFPG